MDDCSEDLINRLPDNLLCHILSNLSTKEAAVTSLLSKRWRYLFAHVPNLEFDDFSALHVGLVFPDKTPFIKFVNRVLKLRGKDHINKFSLKCGDGVEEKHIIRWIPFVLRRGVSDLDLHISPESDFDLPSKVFVTETLVRLRIGTVEGINIDLARKIWLPKLKTLYLDSVKLDANDEIEVEFAEFLLGFPVLEEMVLRNLGWENWDSFSVSSKTLKKIALYEDYDEFENTKTASFDTPNIVYFEYSASIANKYSGLKFDSLVEACIGLQMTESHKAHAISICDEEIETVGDATELLMGICNVKTLYLCATTLETLTICCEVIPMFNNLTRLTIESDPEVGWGSLPDMLKSCPNLETLVFKGILHNATDRCGDVCPCQDLDNSTSSLSSSPVKFLEIIKVVENENDVYSEESDDDAGGGNGNSNGDVEMETKQIKHFLEKMPNLEQVTIYYNTSLDFNLIEFSKTIQRFSVASLKCKLKLIADNLTLSVTLPISLSMEFELIL